MPRLDWLTERPVAHRGLHGPLPGGSSGAVENTASAFRAAIDSGYAIETDVQISADGEAMVHHDDALGRLTEGHGALREMSAAALQAVPFKATADRMMTLRDLCDLVAGRTPLLVELKSRFDGDTRIAVRAAEVLSVYAGAVAVMSFDPDLVAAVRERAPALTRGIVAERHYDHDEWRTLTPAKRRELALLLQAPKSRPQFLAYAVRDLPGAVPWVARTLFGRPLLTWTVRSADDRTRAARYADQMIFEGFRP
jgi:glycerophosphoryl diester phosphodiesterase